MRRDSFFGGTALSAARCAASLAGSRSDVIVSSFYGDRVAIVDGYHAARE